MNTFSFNTVLRLISFAVFHSVFYSVLPCTHGSLRFGGRLETEKEKEKGSGKKLPVPGRSALSFEEEDSNLAKLGQKAICSKGVPKKFPPSIIAIMSIS